MNTDTIDKAPAQEPRPSDLKTQTFKGTLAMGGATLALRAISIVSSLVLANLLDPEAFGLVSGAAIILSTTNLFSGFGLGPALVQTRGDTHKAAYQSFIVTTLTGLILSLIVFLGAGFFSYLLKTPEVTPALQWLSWMIFLGSLSIVPEALLQKAMLFGKVSRIVIVTELSNIIIALTLAYLGYGYMSLVWALLAKSVLSVVLYWVASPNKMWLVPKPWDSLLMKSLLGFGLHATGGGVVTYVYSVIDNVTVLRWLGKSAAGLYIKSYDFTSRSVDSISNVLGTVLLPSYSQLQTDPERLTRAYLKSIRFISFVTVAVSMGMVVTAPEVVSALLNPKWLPMIPAFQVLACVGLVKPLSASTSALFLSRGKPSYNVRAGLVVLFTMLPLFWLLIGFGIVGIALAVLIAHVVGLAFNAYQLQTILKGIVGKMLTAPVPALGAGIVMMGCVQLSKEPLRLAVGGVHNVISVIGLVLVGGISYTVVLYILQREMVREIKGLLLARFTRSK